MMPPQWSGSRVAGDGAAGRAPGWAFDPAGYEARSRRGRASCARSRQRPTRPGVPDGRQQVQGLVAEHGCSTVRRPGGRSSPTGSPRRSPASAQATGACETAH
jgi:hypothetical protein